jgi:hypothetical protein
MATPNGTCNFLGSYACYSLHTVVQVQVVIVTKKPLVGKRNKTKHFINEAWPGWIE